MAQYIPEMPSDIPPPLVANYGIQSTNPLQATEMTSGRVRVRERWRNVPQEVSLTFRLSDYHMTIFEGFIKHEVRNGASQFKINLRMPRSTKLEPYVVKLTETYSGPTWVESATGQSGYWDVSYTAITVKDTRTSEEEYINMILGMNPSAGLDLLQGGINTHWLPEYPQ